ncbi:MAG: deaminase [bacterium]|nr:deaminase [bacterium]
MAIQYPYLPEGREIKYVSEDNVFMRAARDYALAHSLDNFQKTGSVVVQRERVIGRGANGSLYHKEYGCERVRQHIPTGDRYDLCEGCHPKNHSEPKALADARTRGETTHGADLYLYGHWWCCKPCWDAMIDAGIRNVYLLEGSEKLFNTKR